MVTLAPALRVCLAAALVVGSVGLSIPVALGQAPPAVRIDSLGDPLPEGALLRFGTGRFRPPTNVDEIALTPDEKTIVTLGNDLIAWDTTTGKAHWQVSTQTLGFRLSAAYGTHALAFLPDGKHFFTPGAPDAVTVWETATGKSRRMPVPWSKKLSSRIGNGTVRSIDVSPDGKLLALGSRGGLCVCTPEGKAIYEVENPARNVPRDFNNQDRLTFDGEYTLAQFSPDGKTLAMVTSHAPQIVRLLEAATGEERGHLKLEAKLVRMAFSPDSQRIVTTERDSAVRMYELDSEQRLWSRVIELKDIHENYTSAVAYRPDGKQVAVCATDEKIYLLDAKSGEEIAAMTGHTWYPWAVKFTADSKRMYSSGWDGTLRRWDVDLHEQLPPPRGIRASCVSVISPDGRTIAYEDDFAVIRLVDVRDGGERQIALPNSRFTQLVYSADGKLLAGGGTSGENVQVSVFEAATGKLVHRWDWPLGRDNNSHIECLQFNAQGNRLAAGSFRQDKAYLWDLKTGQQIAELPHVDVYGLSFSPDGATLATAGWDSAVRFWDSATGKPGQVVDVKNDQLVESDQRMYTVCYAPEGGLLATAHLSGVVRVWRADTMQVIKTFIVPRRFVFGAMSFSPDGLWLATGAMGGEVELWNPLSGERVSQVGKHQDSVYTLSFPSDGRTLLSGGSDGMNYLWEVRADRTLEEREPAKLWPLLREPGPRAFLAMQTLVATPEQTVPLLKDKLGPIRTLVDGESAVAEAENTLVARRELSVLTQIGTLEARELLRELSKRGGEMGRLAGDALARVTDEPR